MMMLSLYHCHCHHLIIIMSAIFTWNTISTIIVTTIVMIIINTLTSMWMKWANSWFYEGDVWALWKDNSSLTWYSLIIIAIIHKHKHNYATYNMKFCMKYFALPAIIYNHNVLELQTQTWVFVELFGRIIMLLRMMPSVPLFYHHHPGITRIISPSLSATS